MSPTYLDYLPPYPYAAVLDFLAARAIPGVEYVEDGVYWRTASLPGDGQNMLAGWVRVSHAPQRNALAVSMSETLVQVAPRVLERVSHLFDLSCDPEEIYAALAPMNAIRPGLCVPGTRLPGSFNAFEMAVRAVLGQQVTVKAARTLAGRLVNAFGEAVATDLPGLTHVFPAPERLLALDGPLASHLGPLGILAMRSRAIDGLARAFAQKTIDFEPGAEPQAELKKLCAIPGIGNWTAQYIAMRTMGWTDAFLEADAGVKKALAPATAKEMLHMAEAWRPWRSYAVVNLWNSLH